MNEMTRLDGSVRSWHWLWSERQTTARHTKKGLSYLYLLCIISHRIRVSYIYLHLVDLYGSYINLKLENYGSLTNKSKQITVFKEVSSFYNLFISLTTYLHRDEIFHILTTMHIPTYVVIILSYCWWFRNPKANHRLDVFRNPVDNEINYQLQPHLVFSPDFERTINSILSSYPSPGVSWWRRSPMGTGLWCATHVSVIFGVTTHSLGG